MFLEISPIAQNITDITQTSSNLAKSALSEILNNFLPALQILGGVLGIYIIIKIIAGITNHLMRKRIKRIEAQVKEINSKLDELLSKKRAKKSK